MDKAFDFKTAQTKWYARWEASRCFEAQPESNKQPWSIVIPPPNITGNLHMGHALVFTLHDVLTRFKRAEGYDALWVPGVDHAGIATQIIVEKQLAAEGTSRRQLGREKFLERLWAWKNQNQGDIENQLKRLGASVDWTRKRFTMDTELNRAVRKVFVESYRKGLIYRGPRMIQWDPVSQTALSDLEVKHVERQGKLWYLRYPLAADEGHIVVATTRPETMLGDTAVAVHPEDERYKHLIGKRIQHPLTGRQIPIVADAFVDPAFGTGCVKLTPAHDPNDHAAGQRLGLPSITVIGFDAKMTKEAGENYAGLDRFEARKKIVADIEALGLIEKIENHSHQVAVSERTGAVLEPLVSEQWFMNVKDAAQKALQAVRKGDITFTPERWVAVWEHWLNNIQDWCISRQLWWGHRIPAYNCTRCGHLMVEEEAPEKCNKCKSTQLEQDPDTLDTWFSSALWPFSVFGWPDETKDLKRYYPTSVLITGYDILFFWVARMVMAGLTWTEEVPFRRVYFNALVRDESGQKMSKSKGNVIDPLQVMDEFGTDALRFSLAIMASPGTDIALSHSRLEDSRNFCNKLWNAARFVQMNLGDDVTLETPPKFGEAEVWMLDEIIVALGEVRASLENFRFHEAADRLYHLIWDGFCATYIELVKPQLQSGDRGQKATILRFLDYILRSLHPFIPFVTEEIHEAVILKRLREKEPRSLAQRPWPSHDVDKLHREYFAGEAPQKTMIPILLETKRVLLRCKQELGMDPRQKASALFTNRDLIPYTETLKNLASLESLTFDPDLDPHAPYFKVAVVHGGLIAMVVSQDRDPVAERAKLEKERDKLQKELEPLLGRFSDEAFLTKAPEAAVNKLKAQVQEKKARLEQVLALLG